MKVVLDLTRLVREGSLTREEAARLQRLASRDTGSLGISILMSFGAIAVAGGLLALHPTFASGTALGVLFVAAGLAVNYRLGEQWRLLAIANTIIGALLLAGGVVGLVDGRFAGFAFAAALLLVLAVAIRSALLMALVPPAMAAALGSSTGYFHACYMLTVTEPTVTVLVFALLAWLAYRAAHRVPPAFEGLALVFARVSLVIVNFGFWVGSLWGDYPGISWRHPEIYSGASWQQLQAWRATAVHVSEHVFIIGWAAALIGVGVWAARANRRWVVTLVTVFGAIHLYTQWFERLGADPIAIILAGLTIVGIAVVLWRYNSVSMTTPSGEAPA
jgi:iron complex transport system permease protein